MQRDELLQEESNQEERLRKRDFMSEFINENPEVLETEQLPTRKESESDELLFGLTGNRTSLERKRILLKMDHSPQSEVLKAVALLDKMLLISKIPSPSPPELLSDATTDEELPSEEDVVEEEEKEQNEGTDPIDPQEIYDLIAHISDPEHPLSLGQLAVVNLKDITVKDSGHKNEMAEVIVRITPTITHCSLATLIGLGIRVRLERSLPARFRITILLKEGSHQSENQVNKQLNDKERVAAACENPQLLNVVSNMLSTCK